MTPESSPPRALWLMGAFGFLSGLPLSLTAFTLQLWLTTFGISVHTIGMSAMLGLPYTLKFLWSGFFDRMPPGRLAALGRRRGWLVLTQPLLAAAAAAMALSDPAHSPARTILAGLALAFLSASQDILIDAWRIETFPERLQGTALATYVWGYRGAMLTSTSGALWLSSVVGWRAALLALAGLLAAGLAVTLLAPERPGRIVAARLPGWRASVEAAFLAPLRDFLTRPGAVAVLAFVILFRLGKVFADGQAAAFYRYAVHFSTVAIADANLYGWGGTLAGAAAGAWLVLRLGTLRALLLTGGLQALSLGLYLMLLATGPSQVALTAKILLENAAGRGRRHGVPHLRLRPVLARLHRHAVRAAVVLGGAGLPHAGRAVGLRRRSGGLPAVLRGGHAGQPACPAAAVADPPHCADGARLRA